VDSGAIFSVIPERVAEELEIEIIMRVNEVGTDSGIRQAERGFAIIKLEGKEVMSEVFVSPIMNKIPIGLVVLVMLGSRVDSRAGRLKTAQPLLCKLCFASRVKKTALLTEWIYLLSFKRKTPFTVPSIFLFFLLFGEGESQLRRIESVSLYFPLGEGRLGGKESSA
jgi:predicted aspartyl protease